MSDKNDPVVLQDIRLTELRNMICDLLIDIYIKSNNIDCKCKFDSYDINKFLNARKYKKKEGPIVERYEQEIENLKTKPKSTSKNANDVVYKLLIDLYIITNDIKAQKNFDSYDIGSFTNDETLIKKYNEKIDEIKKCKERNGKEFKTSVKYAILSRKWFIYTSIDLHDEFDIFMFIQNCDEMTYNNWKDDLIKLNYMDKHLRVINFDKCVEYLINKTKTETQDEE
jgi:hypothetical protein